MKKDDQVVTLPLRIVRHFPLYLTWIRERMAEGMEYVSAAELAAACGFDPVVTRKELAITGVIGTPRKGFPAAALSQAITVCLGWDNSTDAVLVGAGSLGTALLGYDGFREHNFDFVVAFDTNPEKIGGKLHGVPVRDVSGLRLNGKVTFTRLLPPQMRFVTVSSALDEPFGNGSCTALIACTIVSVLPNLTV